MSEYTEESLDKMLKKDLILIVPNFQIKIAEKTNSNNELLDEIRKFNNSFSKLPSKHSSWLRRLQDVLVKTNIFVLAIRLQDIFKTSC